MNQKSDFSNFSFPFYLYLPLKKIQFLLDLSVIGATFAISYLLRFEFSLPPNEAERMLYQLFFVLPLQMTVLYLYGVHRFIWRYTSLRESRKIISAFLTASVPLILMRLVFGEYSDKLSIPISIIVFDVCLGVCGVLGLRILRRELYECYRRLATNSKNSVKKSVILVGAGQAGVLTLAEIRRRGDIELSVKGFVDDDPAKRGAVINGVKVLGDTADLPAIVVAEAIDHVIIAINQAPRESFKRILDICRDVPVKVRTIPGIYELLQEKVSVSRIRDLQIEDLLGRAPVELDESGLQNFLNGKTIMVTGSGGSIGSELVRQIARYDVSEIILVERSEFALFQIERELAENFTTRVYRAIIADTTDETRMRSVFCRYSPDIVFHAAAHKHVPLMEENAGEAIKNNVFGTKLVATLAGEYGCRKFVLISTDKAVRPRSVMGATKRAAELIIQDLDRRFATSYSAVRFGNVIGSNGSVIPTFREQIKKGGPVTVTHPEMFRFFMTIPEAAQLVMQAGAIGNGGEIFILDMGKPVRILDIARETIKLSGLEPDIDIKIVFTGKRPGEKMVEELESDAEKLLPTTHPKIFLGKIVPFSPKQIDEMLHAFTEICCLESADEVKKVLAAYLPDVDFDVENTDSPARPRSKAKPFGNADQVGLPSAIPANA